MIKFKKPKIKNFYSSKMSAEFLSLDDNRVENAKRILAIEKIKADHEFLIDEVYDYISQDCFNYLLPLIIDSYLDGVFTFDGNLASKFWDTIPEFDRVPSPQKFGVKIKFVRFSQFYELLSSEQKTYLRSKITRLEKISEI